MKKTYYISFLIVLLALISAFVGIFYTTEGERFIVENIYGESIELFGDGIYKYNSVVKAAGNKGTDIVMILVASAFGLLTLNSKKSNRYKFWQAGLLSGLLLFGLFSFRSNL